MSDPVFDDEATAHPPAAFGDAPTVPNGMFAEKDEEDEDDAEGDEDAEEDDDEDEDEDEPND